MSKIISNSVKHSDVIAWTCELHCRLLKCSSCVEVHVFVLETSVSFQDWMFLNKMYIREMSCKFVPFPPKLSMYSSNFSLFWTWTQVQKVLRLVLSKTSCMLFNTSQKLRITSFQSLWRYQNFVNHFHEKNSLWVSLLSKLWSIISLTFSNPFVDVEHNLIRLSPTNMWNVYWIVFPSILFAVCL